MKIKWNSRRKESIKRLACPLLAFTLAAGLIVAAPKLSGEARAVEFDKACSLTVAPGPTSTEFADLDDAKVVIDLYKVADAAPVSGYDTYTYNFKAGYEALEETYKKSGERPDNDTWKSMVQAAAAVALDDANSVEPDNKGKANEKITGLNCGLYLLIARGEDLEDYKTTVTTEDNKQNIVTIANSESHVYKFSPELISLPSRQAVDADGNVINTTAGNSPWVYDMQVTLKPEQSPRYGSLEIVKGLKTYNMSVPAVFVFQVEAELDGKNVYSNVVTMNFTEAGEQKTLIDKQIPVGAEVTVTEVYSGASYKITSDDEQTATIKAADMVSVSFENDHETTSHGGGGVNNHFYNDDDGKGWQLQQNPSVNDNNNK